MSVPSEKVPLVIGKQGVTIKSFRSKSGAKIKVTQENVHITGNPHAIALAKKLVTNHLKNVQLQTSFPSSKVRPNDWICYHNNCNNTNYSWRTECNKCKVTKPSEN